MEPLRELDLAMKAEDPEGLLPKSTTMSGMVAEEVLSKTNGLTPEANGRSLNAADENGVVSLRGVSFRWSSAGEDDENAKTFRELADMQNKKKKGNAKVGAKTSEKLAGELKNGKAKVG